jgi:hypothetical protein
MSGRSITTHCASCFSPPFVIFLKREARHERRIQSRGASRNA